jgi:hypothetical protein
MLPPRRSAMASHDSNALDRLTLEELLESYQVRFPGWPVPPVLNPVDRPEEPGYRALRSRLVVALASGQPVVEWEQQYGAGRNPALEY